MMNFLERILRMPRVVMTVMVLLLVAGGISYVSLPKESFPAIGFTNESHSARFLAKPDGFFIVTDAQNKNRDARGFRVIAQQPANLGTRHFRHLVIDNDDIRLEDLGELFYRQGGCGDEDLEIPSLEALLFRGEGEGEIISKEDFIHEMVNLGFALSRAIV